MKNFQLCGHFRYIYLSVVTVFSLYAHSICTAEKVLALPSDSLKNREFDKEVPQNVCLEDKSIAEGQDMSEDQHVEAKPTQSTTHCSSCSGTSLTTSPAILEFRASYFRPFSKTFRKLTHGGVNYSLETTIPVWKRWNIWGGVDYFSKDGRMIGIDRSVHITIVPITLGLKYIYLFNRYYGLYAGAAGKYYFVETINRVYPMYKTTHRYGLGSVIEVGNLICFKKIVLDIFSSWSFKKVKGPHHLPPNATSFSMQVGGWNIGAGLGYKF
ncbi:MAG TPA: hypothetical protein VGJ00_08195 [Rhabdochlamydiaceae bacterium]|jgi:outer membrane protein